MIVNRLGIIVAILLCRNLPAQDWTQFRGPQGDGHAANPDLPTTWGGFFEKPVWKTVLPGKGWSSPIVVGNRIWVTSSEQVAMSDEAAEVKIGERPYGDTDFQTHASVTLFALEIDADSGEIVRRVDLFHRINPPPIHSTNSYASPTPVSDGERVYCHFGSLGTACINIKDGQVLWRHEFVVEEITGGATSPELGSKLLYVVCDGADEQYVIALDKLSGETVWKRQRPPTEAVDKSHRRSFSTPLLIEFQGRHQLVSVTAQWVVSYDPATGDELWRAKVGNGHAIVPRPVYSNGMVFVCTGYSKPQLVAIRVDGVGDVSASHVAWRSIKQIPEIASPIIVGNEIYLITVAGVATCLDIESGQMHWQHRIGGNFAASPTYTNGRIYFTSKEGVTTVIAPGKSYTEIAVNELFGETLASLAVYKDTFLLRTDPIIYCLKQTKLE